MCAENFSLGGAPTTRDAQAISDTIFSTFIAEEVDKVELVYTKFVSLIASEPTIQTLLPMTPAGELCDSNGNCVDAANDEVFKLTTKGGKFSVSRGWGAAVWLGWWRGCACVLSHLLDAGMR